MTTEICTDINSVNICYDQAERDSSHVNVIRHIGLFSGEADTISILTLRIKLDG
jgi:hypothetical protein